MSRRLGGSAGGRCSDCLGGGAARAHPPIVPAGLGARLSRWARWPCGQEVGQPCLQLEQPRAPNPDSCGRSQAPFPRDQSSWLSRFGPFRGSVWEIFQLQQVLPLPHVAKALLPAQSQAGGGGERTLAAGLKLGCSVVEVPRTEAPVCVGDRRGGISTLVPFLAGETYQAHLCHLERNHRKWVGVIWGPPQCPDSSISTSTPQASEVPRPLTGSWGAEHRKARAARWQLPRLRRTAAERPQVQGARPPRLPASLPARPSTHSLPRCPVSPTASQLGASSS